MEEKVSRELQLIDNRARGIDVSEWQGDEIDWKLVRADGISFAFIRASVGVRRDRYYGLNIYGASDVDILCGGYHYLYPALIGKQASIFAAALFPVNELPPVLDVEQRDLKERHVVEFLDVFTAARPDVTPIIYTSRYLWHTLIGRYKEWTTNHDLWVAHYNAREPALPTPWRQWTFWQHTNQGSVNGIEGNVDLDWFNGTEEELRVYGKEEE